MELRNNPYGAYLLAAINNALPRDAQTTHRDGTALLLSRTVVEYNPIRLKEAGLALVINELRGEAGGGGREREHRRFCRINSSIRVPSGDKLLPRARALLSAGTSAYTRAASLNIDSRGASERSARGVYSCAYTPGVGHPRLFLIGIGDDKTYIRTRVRLARAA